MKSTYNITKKICNQSRLRSRIFILKFEEQHHFHPRFSPIYLKTNYLSRFPSIHLISLFYHVAFTDSKKDFSNKELLGKVSCVFSYKKTRYCGCVYLMHTPDNRFGVLATLFCEKSQFSSNLYLFPFFLPFLPYTYKVYATH